MADIVFVAIAVAFFGLCALYIKGCERILRGREEAVETAQQEIRPVGQVDGVTQ